MFTVGVLGIIIVILALQLKNIKSEYSVVIMIVGCVIIFFYSISGIIKVVEILKKIINDTGINDEQIIILLKIMGISYIAEFVSDIAKDSGYSALSNQIQIYGKITILVVSVPILESLINCINGLLL
ncbi:MULTISPECIES: SpoIIIAC/SpoIIIAD family protein [Eubacterium]|jgi:stage III sporulation protein AD|uniref:SpoIIIAC/SpoIIIAD family protein n=1 Tax=Eubacterium TaxID=1730 RepID=UPI0003359E76|nr:MULTISPECIES: SpoIIIAC/SpoIIIAD family protein [unclassified Eubacterium (in: firmicutes)]MCJ7966101.1 stage III sporulation protein AD [Lachnospiraceae bacterium NSJ-171]RHR36677.1 stage III sporulation protein AD [Eubacterium sp. AF19-12LB]CDA29680.1 stage III sporulation protein AD [Eubacterium sp. CAG:156]